MRIHHTLQIINLLTKFPQALTAVFLALMEWCLQCAWVLTELEALTLSDLEFINAILVFFRRS